MQITPFMTWPRWMRWSTISGIALGVGTIAGFIGALAVLEPYFPATRSYARELIQQAASKQDEFGVGILDLKILALEGQLAVMNNTLSTAEQRLQDNPNDGFFKELKAKTNRDIKKIEDQIKISSCEKIKLQLGSSFPC